jgi:hypothetical protein
MIIIRNQLTESLLQFVRSDFETRRLPHVARGFFAVAGASFNGGNQSAASVYELAMRMASGPGGMAAPVAGGTLTINGVSLGSYDYVVKNGPITLASFTNSDWFTATADSRSAFIVVKGDLTINGGVTFQPSNRKLFTVIYVTGALVINGSISMTARGANHSASGSNLTAGAILIAAGTHGGETNPTIAATGTSGAASVVNSDGAIPTGGSAATSGSTTTPYKTQGGASGSSWGATGTSASGAGADGTAYGGGPGGGAAEYSSSGGGGNSRGGAGGAGNNGGLGNGAGGGAGNPGGAGSGGSGVNGSDGTGGVVIVLTEASVSGSGSIVAQGSSGGGGEVGGASSGGGCVVCFHRGSFSSVSLSATSPSTGGNGSQVHFSL